MATKRQPTVLLIEDDIPTAECCKNNLKNEPIKLKHVNTGKAALVSLQQATPVAILLDLGLPDMDGLDILKHVKQQQLSCAVIAVTAEESIDRVIEVMRFGAVDFIRKPLDANRLIAALGEVINSQQLSYRGETFINSPAFHQFIGTSPIMREIYQKIGKVAKSNVSVLITGKTGTGKEVCAEAIHQESYRQKKPFTAINCAAVAADLLESELFGHVKGAFTGAHKDKQGIVRAADGGTLFLDEIGEMSLDMQSKLLRFVQMGTFYRVGSDRLETVNVRIIAATNRDLSTEIEAGRFREDLFYRLETISIHLPTLHELDKDVLLLAHSFLNQSAQKEQKNFQGFTQDAEEILLSYEWPGNVRQLQNVIWNLVLLNDGKIITADMVRNTFKEKRLSWKSTTTTPLQPAEPAQDSPAPTASDAPPKIILPLRQTVKNAILEALESCKGNKTEAAKLLDIGRGSIYRKLQEWGISL
jgi:DNA-binding NtrC family response regulator